MPNKWVPVSAAATHGGMLVKMRSAALQSADPDGSEFDQDGQFIGEVEFEMLDETEDEQPGVSKGQVDPKLVAPTKLQARRASGEHLCFFCTHEPICAIAGASRAHAQALIVIAGCAQFSMVSGS